MVEAEAPTSSWIVDQFTTPEEREYLRTHGLVPTFADDELVPVGGPPKPRLTDHASRYVALLLDTLATLEATTPEAWDAFEQLCDRIERHLEAS